MISQTQVYNIILNDDVNKLELFLNENPKFDILEDTVSGRRFKLLDQAIISSSVKCAKFLMDLIYFEVMVKNYIETIINHYSEPIFDLFVDQFNECVKNTKNNSCIYYFIFNFMTTTKISESIIKPFVKYCYLIINKDNDIDFFKELIFNLILHGKTSAKIFNYFINGCGQILKDLLEKDQQFKLNMENILVINKFIYLKCFLEFYEKYNIDSEEFYGRIIFRDKYLKKSISFFTHTNLNIKIYLNGYHYKYKYNHEYFNYKDIWRSSHQYSLSFLYIIKGCYNKRKYSKLNLFKSNENFETELLNLFSEKQYATFINWGGKLPYKACMLYGILWSINRSDMGIRFYCHEAKYCLIHFFGSRNRDYDIIKKFFDLRQYFTNNFYDRLLEINEHGLAVTNRFYEYEQFQGPDSGDQEILQSYQEVVDETVRVYNSNKEMIEHFRNGTINLEDYVVPAHINDVFDY